MKKIVILLLVLISLFVIGCKEEKYKDMPNDNPEPHIDARVNDIYSVIV